MITVPRVVVDAAAYTVLVPDAAAGMSVVNAVAVVLAAAAILGLLVNSTAAILFNN